MPASRPALLSLLVLLGGCVSFSARAQIGPVADTGGRGGVSAMVLAGYGWAGANGAAGWTAGVESDGAEVRFAASADIVRLHGEEWGVRAGGHAVEGRGTGDPASMGFHAALLRPLRSRSREAPYDGDPLMIKEFVHLFLGIETRAGVRLGPPMDEDHQLEVGAALTLELIYKYDDAM